jgi:hypothetical protein
MPQAGGVNLGPPLSTRRVEWLQKLPCEQRWGGEEVRMNFNVLDEIVFRSGCAI